MSAAFLTCLKFTLDPAQDGQPLHVTPGDPGGATCQGITLATYREYCGAPTLTPADLGRITPAQVQAIYATKFWNPVRGDDLPVPIALMVFDHGVTAGPAASARCLQRALGAMAPDGWIGPATLAMVAKQSTFKLIAAVTVQQEAFYRSLRGFAEFGHGWLLRLSRRRVAAMALLPTMPLAVASAAVPQPLAAPVQHTAPLAAIRAVAPNASPPPTTADSLMAAELAGLSSDTTEGA